MERKLMDALTITKRRSTYPGQWKTHHAPDPKQTISVSFIVLPLRRMMMTQMSPPEKDEA